MLALSHNELFALLKRTFEALFGYNCDYEALAADILWLECHGLGGIETLRRCSDQLQIATLGLPDNGNHGIARIDAQGHSLVCTANLLGDLSIGRCKQSNLCHLEVANCHDLSAAIPQLGHIRHSGFYGVAWSEDRDGTVTGCASALGPETLPELSNWGSDGNGRSSGTLHLICAAEPEVLREYVRASHPDWPEPDTTAAMLAERYQHSLQNGIAVDEITFLHEIADRILVPASEASRHGAGE